MNYTLRQLQERVNKLIEQQGEDAGGTRYASPGSCKGPDHKVGVGSGERLLIC